MYVIFSSYFLLCYFIWSTLVHADLAGAEDFCRYEIHTSKLSWDKAYQACKQRDMTLVSFSGTQEAKSLLDHLKTGNSMYSAYKYSLDDRSYWIGLRMESSTDGSSEFHWGDCDVDAGAHVTDEFSSLTEYSSATGCGYFTQSSVLMTNCDSSASMGFICEGLDVCFTTYSTTFPYLKLGFSTDDGVAASDCPSSCLADHKCAGFYVSSGVSCTLLSYGTDLPSSLQANDLMTSYFQHKRLFYHGQYASFMPGLDEDELCDIHLWASSSPIVTTTVSQEPSVEEITPTPAFTTTGDYLSASLQTVDESENIESAVNSVTVDHDNASTTTKDFDGATIPDYIHTTIEDFVGQTTPNSFDATTENFEDETTPHGETNSNSFDTTTKRIDGETNSDSFGTTTQNFEGESIPNGFSTKTKRIDGKTNSDSFGTTTAHFEGESIPNGFNTATNEINGETNSNSVDITTQGIDRETTRFDINSNVTTEKTVTSDFGEFANNTSVNVGLTTKETITEDFISPTTATNIYNTKDVTTTSECVTNVTITDFQHTIEHHMTYSELKTTTVSDIETQNNEFATVYNFSSCVCVCRDINDTVEERVERRKSDLKLDRKALSLARNRRISADDPRPSSKYVGVLGIFVLCIFAVLIIGVDILRILQNCHKNHERNKIHTKGKPYTV